MPRVIIQHHATAATAGVLDLPTAAADAVGGLGIAEGGTARHAEDRTVIVLRCDDGSPVTAVKAVQRLILGVIERYGVGAHALWGSARDVHQRSQRVCDIIGGRKQIPPMLSKRLEPGGIPLILGVRVANVVVLALGKHHVSQAPPTNDVVHLAVELHIGVVFEQHIGGTARLGGTDERNALGHCTVACAFGKDMDVSRKRLDGVGGMLVEVVRQENGFHPLVLNEFIKLGIKSHVPKLVLRYPKTLGVGFADGDDLGVISKKALCHLAASVKAKNTNL